MITKLKMNMLKKIENVEKPLKIKKKMRCGIMTVKIIPGHWASKPMWRGRGSPQVDTRRPHVGQSRPEDDFVVVAVFYYHDGLDPSLVRECQGCLWRDPSCVSRRLRRWSRRKRRTRPPWLAMYIKIAAGIQRLLILIFNIKYSFENAKKGTFALCCSMFVNTGWIPPLPDQTCDEDLPSQSLFGMGR